jgi:hypothetical protein
VEYGSTSLALLLFVVCFSGAALFPWGMAVCLVQAFVLASLDLTARRRWAPKQESNRVDKPCGALGSQWRDGAL